MPSREEFITNVFQHKAASINRIAALSDIDPRIGARRLSDTRAVAASVGDLGFDRDRPVVRAPAG